MLDRLTLSAAGVAQMAEGLRQIAALSDPVGEMGEFATARPASSWARCACRWA